MKTLVVRLVGLAIAGFAIYQIGEHNGRSSQFVLMARWENIAHQWEDVARKAGAANGCWSSPPERGI